MTDQRIAVHDYDLLRHGDNVVVSCHESNPSSADSFTATVIDIPVWNLYVDHNKLSNLHPRAGIYQRYKSPIFLYRENGRYVTGELDVERLAWGVVPDDLEQRHFQLNVRRWGRYLGPLPELQFRVGDIVEIPPEQKVSLVGTRINAQLRIAEVNYSLLGERRTDGSEASVFVIKEDTYGGYIHGIANNDIRLVKRGNYWWIDYDPGELKFSSVDEEVAFLISRGLPAEAVVSNSALADDLTGPFYNYGERATPAPTSPVSDGGSRQLTGIYAIADRFLRWVEGLFDR